MFTENIIKFRHSKESKVFFTSDTHFGHAKEFVYGKRGHETVDEHDQYLIEMINDTIQPNDILFHLGDFCLNVDRNRFDEILDSINCNNIYYTWGNHNSSIKEAYHDCVQDYIGGPNLDGKYIYPLTYKNKLTFLGPYKEISVNKKMIVLCHYPIEIWNQQQKEVWHLCGHSHHGNPTTLPSANEGLCLDVGWDGYLKPISFEEVSDIMSTKQYKRNDLHH